MIFEDADLASSVEDCLRYLWPKLREGCKFFSHEPWSKEIVSLFFNKKWWKEELMTEPPGFWGSGRIFPGIGFAMKFDEKSDEKKILTCAKQFFKNDTHNT
ncbi:MAG: hypothetical protein A3K83_04200 [Omnitrophica WOR_2 bacterium RBG_13_44_8b]|nr:MAG: hypothetical protein A3K83_04200 [Omnitrophica WOR_2 bacterium RBG_13_44_8b]